MTSHLPLVVLDLLRTMKALRDAERRGQATEIRQLQALVDAGLESAFGPRGLEAPPRVDPSVPDASFEDDALSLAREALATLAAQKKYFTRKDQESLREAKDRERRLERACQKIIDWHQPSLFATKVEEIMEPIGGAA